jgi:hypothetical protein
VTNMEASVERIVWVRQPRCWSALRSRRLYVLIRIDQCRWPPTGPAVSTRFKRRSGCQSIPRALRVVDERSPGPPGGGWLAGGGDQRGLRVAGPWSPPTPTRLALLVIRSQHRTASGGGEFHTPPAMESRNEQMKPTTHAKPTAPLACSTACGTIVSASIVSTAPAAKVSVNASVVSPAPPSRP